MSAPWLIVFARSPLPGRAKTRLAEALGEEGAAGVYARLLYALLTSVAQADWGAARVVISAASEPDVAYFQAAFPEFEVCAQAGGDMGDRLTAAFGEAFTGGASEVVLVASDVAGLDAEVIQQSFDTLLSVPAVIGPTFDGGYYLLGLNAPGADLFRGVAWSTPQVLAQTEAIARRLGLAMPHLPILADIDTLEDYQRWVRGRK